MWIIYLLMIHSILCEEWTSEIIHSDCKHIVLPILCQCYHSAGKSRLNCQNIQLESLPRLPNNMRWYGLDFSLNSIESVDNNAFSDVYVETLNLNSNRIQTVETTAFNEIKYIKNLFLDHNQLKEFNPIVLSSPGDSLEILDLSYNPFDHLNLGDIFIKLPIIVEFYAKFCQLNNLSLSTLVRLNEYDYTHKFIQLIDLSHNNLTSLCNDFFNRFTNLKELRLNNNNIYLIDNYFVKSLNYLRILDLSSNKVEYFPNLYSSSVEILNVSLNRIQYINDYFATNLHSIRIIDFDSNKNLTFLSTNAFCFFNILNLEHLSFRFTNISSLHQFDHLLCRLQEKSIHRSIIDLNNNVHLICDCILTQYQTYLVNYRELTCIQQGQDRFYISTIINNSSNCQIHQCNQQLNNNLCKWNDSQSLSLNGTCQMVNNDNQFIETTSQLLFTQTTIETKYFNDTYENITSINETVQSANSIRIKTNRSIIMFLAFLKFYMYFR